MKQAAGFALEQLQAQLQRHLLENDGSIIAAIVPGGIGVARRLHIYHHAYRARLQDTLRDTFGHTAAYLGPEWFDADTLAYVEGHPSRRDSLRWYGEQLPAWLQARHPQDGDIGELAAIDWALRHAFDGPNAEVLGLSALAAVAPEAWPRVRFVAHPTAHRMRLRFNTLAIWHAIDEERNPPAAQRLARPLELLLWRVGHEPHFRSLGAFEASALDGLLASQSFAALCEHLAGQYPEAEIVSEVGALLRRWVDESLLSALHLES